MEALTGSLLPGFLTPLVVWAVFFLPELVTRPEPGPDPSAERLGSRILQALGWGIWMLGVPFMLFLFISSGRGAMGSTRSGEGEVVGRFMLSADRVAVRYEAGGRERFADLPQRGGAALWIAVDPGNPDRVAWPEEAEAKEWRAVRAEKIGPFHRDLDGVLIRFEWEGRTRYGAAYATPQTPLGSRVRFKVHSDYLHSLAVTGPADLPDRFGQTASVFHAVLILGFCLMIAYGGWWGIHQVRGRRPGPKPPLMYAMTGWLAGAYLQLVLQSPVGIIAGWGLADGLGAWGLARLSRRLKERPE